jgi:hypothetical protein
MKRFVMAGLVVALAGLVAGVRADDKKADPTGTWTLTMEIKGQKREQTLKLKLDGAKLTGTIQRKDQETPIEDGKFKDGEISFNVSREVKGEKITTKYTGKVTGDTMKGKMESKFGGQDFTVDFEGKKTK